MELKTMKFYENLGSIYNRSERIAGICKKLGSYYSLKNI